MSENVLAIPKPVEGNSRVMTVALWAAQLLVSGILAMAAFTKLFVYTPEGSMALATALGVGRGVVTLIGLVELSAATLILIPRRHVLGALLAALTMAGALSIHATIIGWSGSAAAEMWPMALAVLAAAVFVIFGRQSRAAATSS